MAKVAAIVSVCLLVGSAGAETRPQHRLAMVEVDLVTGVDAAVIEVGGQVVDLPVSENRATWTAASPMVVRDGDVIFMRVFASGEARCTISHELDANDFATREVELDSDCTTRARLVLATRHVLVAPAPRPPFPLEFEEVPLGLGHPGGYFALTFGSTSSLRSHTGFGVELAKAMPGRPWLLGRVRVFAGSPIGMPFSPRHEPSGSRTELRIGGELRHCGGRACVFGALDVGLHTENLQSCDGQECIIVPTRDELGWFHSGVGGVDLGRQSSSLRMALELFRTPDDTVGAGFMVGFVAHLWHDRREVRAQRRRTIAYARTERTAAQTDCERAELAAAQLQTEDAPVREVFVRDPYVARCLQLAAARDANGRSELRARAEREEAAARDAKVRAAHALAQERRRQIESDPCHARRASISRRVSATSDAKERGALVATLPRCD